ncbi:MAG: phosphoribosylglycinamide formyltransferase, partial [Anaerolinea sp.]|nr:phosphoribosylglycinamide formyltransferase [Anaerolinea sp.]
VPDEGVDLGPVLAQKIVEIKPQDTLEDLEKRVHQCEHELLVETINKTILQLEESHA